MQTKHWPSHMNPADNNSMLEQILEKSPVGISVYETSGQCIVVNEAITNIIGATKEQLLAQNFHEIPSWKDCGMYELAKTTLKNHESTRGEFRLVTTFGKRPLLDVNFTTVEQENKTYLVVTVSDITERKELEAALLRSKETHSKVEEIVHIGNWDWDILTGDLFWTDEIFRIFGYQPQEFAATYDAFLNTIHPDDRQSVIDAVNASVADENTPYSIEHRLIQPDGSIRTVHEQGKVYRNDEGKPVRMIGTVHDITERKATEKELELHRKHLEKLVEERTQELRNTQDELVRKERLATLGNLTATVSHELRNPLGAIKPSLYVVKKKIDTSDEKLKNAIQRIDRNITRCDHIIDELLDYTRINNLDLVAENLDSWLFDLVKEHPLHEGIKLSCNPGLNNTEIAFDHERLRRAIINIMDNGIQSMLDASGVNPIKDDSSLEIKTRLANNRIEIIISDMGTGIAEDIQARIFEPLFSTKGFGVGLGMPVVKQIMQQHNGGIEIDSSKHGTRITLWLPR